MFRFCVPLTLSAILSSEALAQPASPPPIALVGATILYGTGGPPLLDATLLLADGKILRLGPRRSVSVPAGFQRIDATGKFIVPGLIDANVHLTPYNAFESFAGPDSLLMLGALSAARSLATRGITTVRDSYGVLPPLLAARDRIASGAATGSTILAAGNILGWGGPWSFSFSGSDGSAPPTEYGRHLRDIIVQGMGESLIDLSPDSLAARLGRYLDTGVDFVKIGVTIHTDRPTFILFSPRALDAMVRTAHARGRKVDVHAGSAEALYMATLAGVDLLQHPETVGDPLPADLVDSIRTRGTICGLMPARLTGAEWARFQAHLALGGRMWPAEKPPVMMQADADSMRRRGIDPTSRPRTASVTRYQNQRRNAESLIRAGCTVAVATDVVVGLPGAESTRPLGDAFFAAVEGLVELGMTPAQAIVAATRNGAAAAGRLDAIGTLAPGKRADLVVLDADPLADIRNLRRAWLVILGGRVLR